MGAIFLVPAGAVARGEFSSVCVGGGGGGVVQRDILQVAIFRVAISR